MRPNLCINKPNISTINKEAKVFTLLEGTETQSKILEQLFIDINRGSSVLLCGAVDFAIIDDNEGDNLGDLQLQIIRIIDGDSEMIYRTAFELNRIQSLQGAQIFNSFSFEWIDEDIMPSSCCCCCKVTYVFQLYTSGLGSPGQSAGIIPGDYYSLTAIEIPRRC